MMKLMYKAVEQDKTASSAIYNFCLIERNKTSWCDKSTIELYCATCVCLAHITLK